MTAIFSAPEKSVLAPNLFIIGAQKSGTTSLHSYLAQHPDCFMSEPKEPGFFVPEMRYYPKDREWYLSLFEAAGSAKVIGESSTHYSKRPMYEGVAERIIQFCPEARFIYIMRDPVRRALSHYWHNVRLLEEHRPILKALEEDPQYRAFGDYKLQLEPFHRLFGRDRVMLLIFEELIASPQVVVNKALRWLDLTPFPPGVSFEAENVMPDRFRRSRGFGLLSRFRSSVFWESVAPAIPKSVRTLGTRLAEKSFGRAESHRESEAGAAYLRTWADGMIESLEDYLGMEFGGWKEAPHKP